MCGLSRIQFLDRLVESDTFDVISAHSISWRSTFQTEIVDINIFNISVTTLYLMVALPFSKVRMMRETNLQILDSL